MGGVMTLHLCRKCGTKPIHDTKIDVPTSTIKHSIRCPKCGQRSVEHHVSLSQTHLGAEHIGSLWNQQQLTGEVQL